MQKQFNFRSCICVEGVTLKRKTLFTTRYNYDCVVTAVREGHRPFVLVVVCVGGEYCHYCGIVKVNDLYNGCSTRLRLNNLLSVVL